MFEGGRTSNLLQNERNFSPYGTTFLSLPTPLQDKMFLGCPLNFTLVMGYLNQELILDFSVKNARTYLRETIKIIIIISVHLSLFNCYVNYTISVAESISYRMRQWNGTL
jgi:hypothetical protein